METDLYPPVKRHLERLGLEVKGEVCGCDLVALSEGSPNSGSPSAPPSGRGRENDARVKKLCRFLGFGLLTVDAGGRVDVVAEPMPWKPRRDETTLAQFIC